MDGQEQKQDRWRDQATGQYTYQNDWQRLCVCGHTLGVHAAEAPHDCLLYSLGETSQERREETPVGNCRCEKFRPKRAKGKFVYADARASTT